MRRLLLSLSVILLCLNVSSAGVLKPPRGMQLIRGHPQARGLVGFWLMNEGTGNIVQDLSGNGFTGTAVTPIWSAGKYGPAIDTTGANNNYDTPFVSSPYDNGFSIVTWVKPSTIAVGVDYIIDDSAGATGFCIRRSAADAQFFCYSGGGAGLTTIASVFAADEWIMVAGVHDTDNKLYINGVLRHLQGSGLPIDNTTDTMRIGSEYDGNSGWAGLISHVYIYNRGLSSSDLQQLCREPFCMMQGDMPAAMMYSYATPPAVVVTPYYYRGLLLIPILPAIYYLRKKAA